MTRRKTSIGAIDSKQKAAGTVPDAFLFVLNFLLWYY
jgi:hypothetical protein